MKGYGAWHQSLPPQIPSESESREMLSEPETSPSGQTIPQSSSKLSTVPKCPFTRKEGSILQVVLSTRHLLPSLMSTFFWLSCFGESPFFRLFSELTHADIINNVKEKGGGEILTLPFPSSKLPGDTLCQPHRNNPLGWSDGLAN